MTWREVVTALVEALVADDEVQSVLGGAHVYRAQDIREPVVPSYGWTLVADTEEENLAPAVVQWEIFSSTEEEERVLEERLRAVCTAPEGAMVVGGIPVFTPYEEISFRTLPTQRPGLRHAQLDVRYEPAREPVA